MRRGFEDFFHYRFSMKSDEIEEIMAKVEGMNAVEYSKELGLNLDDTYMYMIRLL